MNDGRIEVTNITNYKRIKKLIKVSKHIGLVDKAGFREIITCDIPSLAKPKGFIVIDEMFVRDYGKFSKWKYLKKVLRNQFYNPVQEILIFDTRIEAIQWLSKSDSILVKMQKVDGMQSSNLNTSSVNTFAKPEPNAQEPITTIAIEPWQPFNNG